MNLLRSIVSCFMAIIIAVASVGVTVNAHVCGGQIQSTALFTKAEPCGMMKLLSHVKHVSKTRNKCCDEQTKIFKTSEDNGETFSVLSFTHNSLALEFILPVVGSSIPQYSSYNPSLSYFDDSPPDLRRDIVVATRTLLI